MKTHLVFVSGNKTEHTQILVPQEDNVIDFTRNLSPFVNIIRHQILANIKTVDSVSYISNGDLYNSSTRPNGEIGWFKSGWFKSDGGADYSLDITDWTMHVSDFLVFSNAFNIMPLRPCSRRFNNPHKSEPWYYWIKYLGLGVTKL